MNKVVLITGSSRGLGKAIALKFAQNHYDIIINYYKSEKEAYQLKKIIEKEYEVSCLCIKADISKESEIEKMFETVKNNFEKIDVLINNAGITLETLIEEKNKESFDQIMNTNLIGPFLCSKYFSKLMSQGTIVNVSSTNAFDGHPMTIEYDASKSALLSLTRNLAIQYAPNIRVNAVVPGWIKTDMSKIEDKELEKAFVEEECNHILLHRYAEAIEIANVVYFLASPESSYINASFIVADGGSC